MAFGSHPSHDTRPFALANSPSHRRLSVFALRAKWLADLLCALSYCPALEVFIPQSSRYVKTKATLEVGLSQGSDHVEVRSTSTAFAGSSLFWTVYSHRICMLAAPDAVANLLVAPATKHVCVYDCCARLHHRALGTWAGCSIPNRSLSASQ